jgi:uncharacterized protein (DUF1684 family)
VIGTVSGAEPKHYEAFNPSCSYDPAWVCPLAPPPNRLGFAVSAGERHEWD